MLHAQDSQLILYKANYISPTVSYFLPAYVIITVLLRKLNALEITTAITGLNLSFIIHAASRWCTPFTKPVLMNVVGLNGLIKKHSVREKKCNNLKQYGSTLNGAVF